MVISLWTCFSPTTKAMTCADVTAAGDAAVKAVVGEDRFTTLDDWLIQRKFSSNTSELQTNVQG